MSSCISKPVVLGISAQDQSVLNGIKHITTREQQALPFHQNNPWARATVSPRALWSAPLRATEPRTAASKMPALKKKLLARHGDGEQEQE